jgi:hypothetical protein
MMDAIQNPAMLITLLTALAYLAAFSFEVGYLNFFGINYTQARVTTESLIIFGFICLILAFYIISNKNFLVTIWKPSKFPASSLWRLVVWKGRLMAIAIIIIFPYVLYYDNWVIPLIVLCTIFVITLIEFFQHGAGKKGLNAKLEAMLDAPPEEPIGYRTSDIPYVRLIIMLLFMVSLSAFAGKYFATTRKTYLMTNDNYVIVKVYSGRTILAEYDKKSSRFTKHYRFLDNLNDLQFKAEDITIHK